MVRAYGVAWILISAAGLAIAEMLPLPPRPAEAPKGSDLVKIMERMPLDQREAWIWNEVLTGNVPSWNRGFVEVPFTQNLGGSNYSVVLKALPDYLALGSEEDYLLCPMTPLLGQRLADKLGCVLPTRKMVNLIWTNSSVKLNPQPIPPSDQMITMPVFADHNEMVRQQRDQHTNAHPFGALVSGHKKDVVISSKIYTNFATATRRPVVIYGWHYASGVPIQPLYNGHEETWADYSHGIRLIRGQVLINGISMSITNMLTNPALAPLLHDETPSEGATNGIIPIPNYRRRGAAPTVLKSPRSVSIAPGNELLLSVAVSGDEPMHYEWRLNNIARQTGEDSTLAISNVTIASAGTWSVVASNDYGSSTSRVAVVQVREPGFPVLFYEDFEPREDQDWVILWGAADGVSDYTAELGFDHTHQPSIIQGVTELIPSAPNSLSGSHAARLTVNANDTSGVSCAVNLFSPVRLSNDFALKFDCWINYPGGALGVNSTGSTQHVLFGLNHSSSLPAWDTHASDGFWFAMSGEGGDSRDYRAYLGGASASAELLGSASGLSVSNHSAALFQTLFPSSRFETSGAPGKQWVAVELRCTNNIVTWSCDGSVIALRPENSAYKSGRFMLGLADFFPSIANPAKDSFVLLDNVRVEDLSGKTRILETQCRQEGFRMIFSAIPGRSYSVGRSTDLITWTEAQVLTAACGPLVFLDSALASRRFYRVQGPL